MGSLNPETCKPTIVIVPGSFSPAFFYDGVVNELKSHGYEALAIDYPSIGRRDPKPPATMSEDAGFVQTVTTKIANQGKDSLLMTHSYGGIPGTESLKGLTKSERKAEGKKGGIIRILYMTSVIPEIGGSLKDGMGDLVPEYLIVEVSVLPSKSHRKTYL